MGYPVFSDVQSSGVSLLGAATMAITNAARKHELSELMSDAAELFSSIHQDGITADQWFEKLGDEWSIADAHKLTAMKSMEACVLKRFLTPEQSFTTICYFPPF